MKLIFQGHNYKYAAEQMLLTLFPGERPVYGGQEENTLRLSLHRGETWITACALLHWQGKTARHSCRAKTAQLTGEKQADDRLCQRILKLAFYRAGVEMLGREPPWGAMTGVRPVKIPARAMGNGATPAQAEAALRRVYRVSPLRARLAVECAQVSLDVRRSLQPEDISLYVGIPFCPTRCAYCSFISADAGRSLRLIQPYVDALKREIAAAGAAVQKAGRRVRSVYFGGGTPTTLTAPQLEELLTALERHLNLSGCIEYTVEAGRPDTLSEEKLAVLAGHGVGRLSVNPQTMEDSVLRAIGRRHTAGDTERAYELARRAGDFSINMDIIAGLPRDSPTGFRRTVERVLALGPENVTVHNLAMKRGAELAQREADALPNGEQVAEMLSCAWYRLAQAGYGPYYLYRQKFMSGSFENVGWRRPGQESYYNVCMMEELQPVLALGAGGVTKLVDLKRGSIVRRANPKYPQDYLARIEEICRGKEELPWPIS